MFESSRIRPYQDAYREVTHWIEEYHTIRSIHRGLPYGSPQDMRTPVALGQAQWTPLRA